MPFDATMTDKHSQPAAFDGTVVAVTGSIGKSTTARLIVAVLGNKLHGLAGTRDRGLGAALDLMVSTFEPEHGFAVVELSAERGEEATGLASCRTPWVGVVTQNFETLDVDGWKTREAAATLALLQTLPGDGWAILDGDDRLLRQWESATSARTIRVGRGPDCDLTATEIATSGTGLEFSLQGCRFGVPALQRHLLHPVLFALAVGRVFNVALADMAKSLAALGDQSADMQAATGGDVLLLADDPRITADAAHSGLRILHDTPTTGRRIVVCGELQTASRRNLADVHRQIGAGAVTVAGADCLVATGQYLEQLLAGAREAGMPRGSAIACRSPRDLPSLLAREAQRGDVVLVRGRVGVASDSLFKTQPQAKRLAG